MNLPMTQEKQYYVYMTSNFTNRVIYTGVTNSLVRRAFEHREGEYPGFTKRYKAWKLVYYEIFDDPVSAITREKQLKAGPRRRKVELIERENPTWRDFWHEL
jgi:putative endonuclease